MSRIQKRFRLLANPAFFWYVCSALLATFGSGTSYVAMSWWILEADNSIAATACLMFCFWVPTVVLGPLFGVIADRYSRKWLMILGNGARGLILILFAFLIQGPVSALALYLLMFVLGLVFSTYLPATMTLVREIVPPEDLLYANAALDTAYEIGNVVGMGSAGLFLAMFSQRQTMLVVGILFSISALVLTRISVKTLSQTPGTSTNYIAVIVHDFILGLKYLAGHTRLIVLYSVQLCILVAFMTAPILLAPFVKNVLHATAVQFGYIDAAISAGVIIGNMCVPWIANRIGFMRTTQGLCAFIVVLLMGFSVTRSVATAKTLNFFIGMGLAVWPLIVTQAQHATEFAYQARVQSVFQSLSGMIILSVYFLLDVGGTAIPISYFYGLEAFLVLCAVYLLWRYRFLLADKSVIIETEECM